MKKYLSIILPLALSSCSGFDYFDSTDFDYGRGIQHEEIVLGGQLDNPYKTENMQAAFGYLYPTKSREPVQTTDLYVRFLPSDEEQFATLEDLGLNMTDHPMDYEILREGDWYRDPTLPENAITWQYALVPKDFTFPKNIRHEVLQECFLAENAATKSLDVDWAEVERQAYRLSGNSLATKAGDEVEPAVPSGRISIVDPHFAGGKPIGVAGVCVVCRSFMKFDKCFTDIDGYYKMKKTFSSEVHYNLLFKNEKKFSIGFNFLLVPASVSTLGTADAKGVNLTVTDASETKLYTRSVVNNAAYDYISKCGQKDFVPQAPPQNLRIWIFNKVSPSSCIMMRHGTVVDMNWINSTLGNWAKLVSIFSPDITIGTASGKSYDKIYSSVVHELAHASHYAKVGNKFWDTYIKYIATSFVMTGDSYGDGHGEGAGCCDVGESWAYYMESKIYKERYGGSFPSFGAGEWFRPQIMRYLDDNGIGPKEIFEALEESVADREALRNKLCSLYPAKKKIIDQVFNRYI